ncbi:MAG: protein-export chaperone SecB [Kangiellaceae bacterium]|nr:protein-export chaperone SecB [Kangiellaceae bacterium]|tara:strand:- start:2700 stop:3179 length:480 start_codon:yes stop_codon:yes gene_type:complete
MAEQQQSQAQFQIQRIYVKDISFEAPNLPGLFRETNDWKPEINMELHTNSDSLGDDNHDVTLQMTVTAKLGEQVAFLIEVKQAGIFTVKGLDETQLRHTLGAYCPTILYPYARETISSLSNKGGFPPLNLAPVNFDALYAQHMQKQQAAQEEQAKATVQ